MSFLDTFISLFAPFDCLGCGNEANKLLCAACREEVPVVPPRCYICRSTSFGYETCRDCRHRTSLRRVVPVYVHDDLAKELLHAAKYERAAAGFEEIASLMAEKFRRFFDGSEILLVAVPTASSRVRERGYDHALLLARHISRRTDVRDVRVLRRIGQAHQVGSNRTARIAHVQGAFRVVHPERVRNKHIVLVDDVCTTGATLEEAARTLKKAGARQIDALVFSQPD